LVTGRLGDYLWRHALEILQEAAVEGYTLEISPYAAHLSLLGTSRYAQPEDTIALVFDFGGTLIKRACAAYQNGALSQLHLFSPHATDWERFEREYSGAQERAEAFFERLVTIITQTWVEAGQLVSRVLASIAAYIENGHPMPTQAGLYLEVSRITHNLQSELAARLSQWLNKRIEVKLAHDGTATGTAYAGQELTAVVLIGTAMGIGFPPDNSGLGPISNVQILT
jgi:hypothetical protein